MAGLLGDVLPYIYQRANALKRGIGDFVADPMGSIAQGVNYANDRAGGLLEATRAASEESAAGGGLMYGPANKKLAGILANAYNPMGITVYHGSPHKFAKFDSSKIGTGEGAQAYGHGLYLAESPDVAKSYADSVSRLHGATTTVEGSGKKVPVPLWAADRVRKEGIDSLIDEWTKRLSQSQAEAKTSLQPWIAQSNADRFAQQLDELRAIKGGGSVNVEVPGSLYKVDLPDSAVARMLDWDKPLSQQAPEVQATFKKLGMDESVFPHWTGQQAYEGEVRALTEFDGLPKRTARQKYSEQLRQLGIPGIRYLDGGSRGAGGGTSNFVVFPGEESLLTILERNGMPLPK